MSAGRIPRLGTTRDLYHGLLALAAACLCVAAAAAQAPDKAGANELDAFMAKVLARRDVNRATLSQYILDDVEVFEIVGPGRVPLHRGKREFAWYVRDGLHVRSPVRFDGVAVGDAERRKYEEEWIRRERERLERRRARAADQPAAAPADAGPPVSGESPMPTPRFVSEAYFMDFKFEPGNYYLAGREQLEGKRVVRIEYYPTRLFNDDHDREGDPDPDRAAERKKRAERQTPSERKQEADINRKMNKTALVTLWVDPSEFQIVKYTFDNVWMDFLPGAWLVRVDGIHASMSMGQPLPGVWLPRQIDVAAGFSLATGQFEATYARTFANYKLADVTSIIRVPKGPSPSPEREDARASQPERDDELEAVHGPAVPDVGAQAEVVREIRVHGNAAVADADVVALAGLAVGQTLAAGAIADVERRLTQSGRFESVEVRKRYRSLTDETDVAIVLLVHEKPGVASSAAGIVRRGGTFGRVGNRLMFLPILNYADGYGFSYGARLSTRDLLGAGEHLSVPLTWGATRRAAVEVGRTFKTGPLTRVMSSAGISQRENPRFALDDRRIELKGRAERLFARLVRTGLEASRSTVDFGGTDDRLWTLGADVALDTRAAPSFPRNAVLLAAGWTGLHIRSRDERIDRYTTDARGYLGLVGQAVAAGRVQYAAASSRLPDYERLLLGGASTLRGFRAGTFDGDRMLVTSFELRVPISSVLRSARLGVLGFVDAGKAWDAGGGAASPAWHRGVGGGVFLIAPLVTLNLDIGRGLRNGDTRLHLAAGFGF